MSNTEETIFENDNVEVIVENPKALVKVYLSTNIVQRIIEICKDLDINPSDFIKKALMDLIIQFPKSLPKDEKVEKEIPETKEEPKEAGDSASTEEVTNETKE